MRRAFMGVVLCLALLIGILPSNGFAEEQNHTIVYENGMHYINLPGDDPIVPSYKNMGDVYRFVVYCMNNSLHWPHTTPSDPDVPLYREGYLDELQYDETLQSLTLLLYAGYPNNGKHFYELTDTIVAVPAERFNSFLLPSDELKAAFPSLNTEITYGKYQSGDAQQKKLVNDFMTAILQAQLAGNTAVNGLSIHSITNSMFYHAMTCLQYAEITGDPLAYFASAYAADYYVTEKQAYDATQSVVWYLLKEAGVEANDNEASLDGVLAQRLYEFAVTAKLSDYLNNEPSVSQISMERSYTYGYDSATNTFLRAPMVFRYNESDGRWQTETNRIIAPANFPQVLSVTLPENVKVLETGGTGATTLSTNTDYTLVWTGENPPSNPINAIQLATTAKWIKGLKQYSPNQPNVTFQHMAGEVVDQKDLRFSIPIGAALSGSLTLKKSVYGDAASDEDVFTFTIKAMDQSDPSELTPFFGFDEDCYVPAKTAKEAAAQAAAAGLRTYWWSMPEPDKNGNAWSILTLKLKANEVYTLRNIHAGVNFVITESDSAGYDRTEYKLRVNGSEQPVQTGNALSVNIGSGTNVEVEFGNYRSSDPMPPLDLPKTGDSSPVGLWLTMLILSLGALLVMPLSHQKGKRAASKFE